jgi:type IV pilus assembly protein PilA
MKRVQQGFTLIELMIVIAIVGILAAVALPAYQDYTIRAKLSEALAKSAEGKTTIAEFYTSRARLPTTLAEAGLTSVVNTPQVQTQGWQNGVLTIDVQDTVGGDIDATNDQFVLSVASTQGGVITWRCKAQTIPAKYMPASCR